MYLKEVMKRYETFIGKNDFQLKNVEQLKSIHNIDFKKTAGYETLSEESKLVYRNFIVRFFNAWGLGTRSKIVPYSIHNTLERTYYTEVEQYIGSVNLGTEHIVIDCEGKELFTIYSRYDAKKSSYPNQIVKKEDTFLRFDYERNGVREWLHVINNGFEWY